MTQPRRGEIWSLGGRDPRPVIIVSANMFNELPDHPFVLAMQVRSGSAPDALLTVQIVKERWFAEVDTIGRVPKALLAERLHEGTDVQTLTDIYNRLFKVLATN